MTHVELQAAVIALCKELGLLWHCCGDPRRCLGPRGFPDLFIAGPGGVIIAELKTEYDDTTAEQDLWGWTLTRALPAAWTVWRQEQLADGTIRTELEELTR